MAAKSPTAADIRANILHAYIDTDQEYFDAAFRVTPGYVKKTILAQRYGQVPVGVMNMGAVVDGSFDLLETGAAILAKFLHITANLPLAIGSQFPTFPVRLHDPADGATTTNDILIPKGVFGEIREITADGAKERIFTCPFQGVYDATAGGAWKLFGS